MSIEGKLVRYVEQKKIERCELCHNKMEYIASGVYRCTVCGSEVLDDFGKVKLFLEENGPTPQIIIAQRTGVSMDKIGYYPHYLVKDVLDSRTKRLRDVCDQYLNGESVFGDLWEYADDVVKIAEVMQSYRRI